MADHTYVKPMDPAPHFIPPMLPLGNEYLAQNVNDTNISSTPMADDATAIPTVHPTTSPATNIPCQWVLYEELGNSRVRLWDVIILVPNALFLLFLLLRLRITITKLQRTSSPIFLAFYGLVFLTTVISVLRCVVAMTVNAAVPAGDLTDKLLWLIVRFFMLAMELSVVSFGLAFGHLDSRTSIQRVLLVTFFIALAYSVTQGALEILYPDERFHVIHTDREYDIFGHGGMLFWFACSVFFFVIYFTICILPWTKIRNRFALPSKRSFYYYCGFLCMLSLLQAIGSGLLYYNVGEGMCIVDITTYIYFTCLAPLVYGTFLRDFFATSQPPSILFSYKAQVDESLDEDHVSLPQQICSSAKLETDLGMAGSYDSTHFDVPSPNPLYNSDYQPRSLSSEMEQVASYRGQEEPQSFGYRQSINQHVDT